MTAQEQTKLSSRKQDEPNNSQYRKQKQYRPKYNKNHQNKEQNKNQNEEQNKKQKSQRIPNGNKTQTQPKQHKK